MRQEIMLISKEKLNPKLRMSKTLFNISTLTLFNIFLKSSPFSIRSFETVGKAIQIESHKSAIYLAESGKFQIYMINSLVSLHWAEVAGWTIRNRLSQTAPCRHCSGVQHCTCQRGKLGRVPVGPGGPCSAPGWSSKQGRQNNQHCRNKKWTQRKVTTSVSVLKN